MTQLERLKQEVKTLLDDIEFLEKQNFEQHQKLTDHKFYFFMFSFVLFLTNSLWFAVFTGG